MAETRSTSKGKEAIHRLEPWMDLDELSFHFKASKRWLESRRKEGMPSKIIAGRVKGKPSACEEWLEAEGHISTG